MTWAGASPNRTRGRKWMAIRQRILTRDRFICCECKRKGTIRPADKVDHITPLSKGGTDDEDNLESLCNPCHDTKTAREAAEAQGRTFRARVKGCRPDGTPLDPDHAWRT